MEFYFLFSFILFLLCLCSFGQNIKIQSRGILTMLLLLFLVDGLRWESGTDWTIYYNFFKDGDDDIGALFEPGYILVNKIIRSFSSNYTVFLLFHSFLTYLTVWHFSKKYSLIPQLSILLFFLLFVSVQGMNRQFLAIFLCLWSLDFLLSGKNKSFLCIVLIACFFHSSALIFLVGFFLNKKYDTRIYVLLLLVFILLSLSNIVSKIINIALIYAVGDVAYRIFFYSESDSSEFVASGTMMVVAIIKRLLWIIPILMIKKENGNVLPKSYNLFLNYYFFGLLIYLIFNGSELQIIVSRASVYFNIFEIILIPYVICSYKKIIPIRLFIFIVYLYGLLTMSKGIEQYNDQYGNPFIPYKSVIYNNEVKKNV